MKDNRKNLSIGYEEYRKKIYELAAKDPDPEYAIQGVKDAESIKEIERFYREGYSVEEAVYAFCF